MLTSLNKYSNFLFKSETARYYFFKTPINEYIYLYLPIIYKSSLLSSKFFFTLSFLYKKSWTKHVFKFVKTFNFCNTPNTSLVKNIKFLYTNDYFFYNYFCNLNVVSFKHSNFNLINKHRNVAITYFSLRINSPLFQYFFYKLKFLLVFRSLFIFFFNFFIINYKFLIFLPINVKNLFYKFLFTNHRRHSITNLLSYNFHLL